MSIHENMYMSVYIHTQINPKPCTIYIPVCICFILFHTETWKSILCYKYCLEVYNYILACTSLVICMNYSIVQESAILYRQGSDRDIPLKNCLGRWSAFRQNFFKNQCKRICQCLQVFVDVCTLKHEKLQDQTILGRYIPV